MARPYGLAQTNKKYNLWQESQEKLPKLTVVLWRI